VVYAEFPDNDSSHCSQCTVVNFNQSRFTPPIFTGSQRGDLSLDYGHPNTRDYTLPIRHHGPTFFWHIAETSRIEPGDSFTAGESTPVSIPLRLNCNVRSLALSPYESLVALGLTGGKVVLHEFQPDGKPRTLSAFSFLTKRTRGHP
jgi:hypothetical protein